MKNLFKILILCSSFLIVSCDNSKDQLFKNTSKELNEMCPMTIDQYTVLTGTGYINGDFIYKYTCDIDNFFNDFDLSKYEWEQNQYQGMKNLFCTDPELQVFRDYDINVIWKYYDSWGNHFSEMKVNSNNCSY
tara:strand:- start:460 stop:858 length:399 start_codon:yes stop_codon:yes gene_type:complete